MHIPQFVHLLSTALEGTLPGKEAQYQMAPAGREERDQYIRNDIQEAAVLVLLYQLHESWHTVLIKRIDKEGDSHSGQMSFPGGRREAGEPLHHTAVRESYEEISSPLHGVRILGQLSKLHVPVSNFMVTPFVGYAAELSELSPQESEVDTIVEMPLERLLNQDVRRTLDMSVRGFRLHDVPCFVYEGRVIWGATAMILNEFLTVIQSSSTMLDLL